MTSHKEPHFSYTEATLRREVHTDNSHWELMYKAMLAQLMTYVDAAVVRALAERGVDHLRASGTSTGRGGSQPYDAGRTTTASAAQGHRYDPSMNGGFGGIPMPPWLQPFTLPEQVRFTRTPDALLRHALPDDADMPVDDLGCQSDDAVPIWKRPVVLPANVRFNRTPDAKPIGHESEPDVVEAQTFTDEAALPAAAAPRQAEASAEDGPSLPAEAEPGLPAWLGMVQVEPAAMASATEQAPCCSPIPVAEPSERHDAEDLASAWLQAHDRIVARKPLRLTADQTLGDVLTAVETVALDPEASMNPYGDSRLWTAPAEAARPSAGLHPFGDPAFWIEGLAEAGLGTVAVSSAAIAGSAIIDALPEHPFGLVGLESLDTAAEVTEAVPDRLALPAPDWLYAPAGQPEAADRSRAGSPATQDLPEVVDLSEVSTEPEAAGMAADSGPYGDSALWLTLIGVEDPAASVLERMPEVVDAEAASLPATAPVGIASPADARSFVGPARAGRRGGTGTPHGLAPFEATNRVRTDPALYEDPPLDLLMLPPEPTGEVLSSGALEQNARLLEGVLEEFGIRGEIIDVRPGPVVTLYELEPAPGTKSSRVIGLADDIARSMSAVSAPRRGGAGPQRHRDRTAEPAARDRVPARTRGLDGLHRIEAQARHRARQDDRR